MGQQQCEKCGEIVDEAKAFCPGCGASFVDEKKRVSVSEFDQSNPTVQLGQTMFNQMLSDMGLSTAKGPDAKKPRVQVVAPAVPTAAPEKRENVEPGQPASTWSRYRNWIIAAVVAAVLLFVLAALVIAIAFILYFREIG